MPRDNPRYVRHMAQKEMHRFLQERALSWVVRGKFALGTDYAIRALNQRSGSPLNLLLGCIAGTHTNQTEFVQRCQEGLRHVCKRHGLSQSVLDDSENSLWTLPEVRQHSDVLRPLWQGSGCTSTLASSSSDQPPNRVADDGVMEEVLHISEHEPFDASATSVRRAACAVSREPLVELLEPKHSTSGRGLYARQMVRKNTVLLSDQPIVAVRMNDECCAHCLKRLDKKPSSSASAGGQSEEYSGLGVPCPYCKQETYCSSSCKDLAWRGYHACLCPHVNREYGAWEEAMREQLMEGGGEAGSNARAALTCLAIGKICGMATVQQAHPLSLPGIAGLRGIATYEASTALGQVGAMAVTIANALRQTHLYMEEIIALFGIMQTNEFLLGSSGVALYPLLSFLNHSCEPNCIIAGPSRSSATQADKKQLVTISDVRDGEQLTIDYNANLTSRLSYEDRKLLFAQRHFECFCPKCVLKR